MELLAHDYAAFIGLDSGPIGHSIQQVSEVRIVCCLEKADRLRSFEARRLEPVFQRCDTHEKKGAQLRLPTPHQVAKLQIRTPRRAELKENIVGKKSDLFKFGVDFLPKNIARVDRRPEILRAQFSSELR